jgi:hypothetical protein
VADFGRVGFTGVGFEAGGLAAWGVAGTIPSGRTWAETGAAAIPPQSARRSTDRHFELSNKLFISNDNPRIRASISRFAGNRQLPPRHSRPAFMRTRSQTNP